MVTFSSNEQKTLAEAVLNCLKTKNLSYRTAFGVNNAVLEIECNGIKLFIYDDGEGQISGGDRDYFFEVYDFKSLDDLMSDFLNTLEKQLEIAGK